MSNKINILLTAVLVFCALSLVRSQYHARNLFIEKGRLDQQASQLEIDWDQLRLDYSTLSKNSRIEQIARTDLNMVPLTPERTQYLTEGEQ